MIYSVLIPLYNSEKYLAECLDSVLAQNFDDYEIIIVDDGSTDNSGAIADQYQNENPQIRVIHKENEGVLLTRRRLLKEAKGEYILWVDSDDAVKQNWMSDLYREIQATAPDMIISNYENYDDPNKLIRSLFVSDRTIIEGEQKHDVLIKLILGKDLNELWSKCIKRELIDIDGNYTEFKNVKEGDDLFCLLPIFDMTNKIVFLDRAYYRYRVISTSITHTASYKKYYSVRTIFERIDSYIVKWFFSENECSQVKDRFATTIIDCIVACANSPETSIDEFKVFACDVTNDENNKQIYSDGKRHFSSKNYQRFYDLFIEQKYNNLYNSIIRTTKLSRIKRKLIGK